jgi:ABC-type antimicrobial peptide transport system permease subunit
VIAAICVILSMVASVLVCSYLNVELAAELGASLFVFGPMSVAILVGIALLTAVIATYLPVHNAAKKKPVESIRAL